MPDPDPVVTDPDDDGRTVFARLVGVLLLLFPPLLIYFLIAFWPRPVCDVDCQDATKPPVCAQVQTKLPEPEATATPAPTPESTAAPTPTPEATPADSAVAQELKRLNQRLDDEAKQWAPCAALYIPSKREFMLAADVRLLLLVMIAGALGAYVHAAQSYTTYIGNRKYKKQWTWWYVLRIPVGSALALFLYFTTRGGLITGTTPPDKTVDLNIFGIMSFAALAGLFSKQLIDKLGEVFSNFFKSDEDEKREDKYGDKKDQKPPSDGGGGAGGAASGSSGTSGTGTGTSGGTETGT